MNATTKRQQILDGLRRLSARQAPGDCFTTQEIAVECGVDSPTIQYTERKALAKVIRALRNSPGVVSELVEDAPDKLAAALRSFRDPKITGRPTGRPRKNHYVRRIHA